MALNISKGNMYGFVTHTWNTVKGECPHGCTYCYMHRFGNQKPIRFDQKELKTDLGTGNFIFVGSSCDMFAEKIPEEWIIKTLEHCSKYDNKYLFQSKNPINMQRILPKESVVCVTMETNRWYPDIMKNSPWPFDRFKAMRSERHPLYITIEPIMDFDMETFMLYLVGWSPVQINIGADSSNWFNKLPEPPKEKILELIEKLKEYTVVHLKPNLNRLIK